MPTVIVRYRPKADQVDHNAELVREVFEELAENRPGGIRYATFRLDDGTFIHIANVEGEENPLERSDAFARFTEDIADRCEPGEGPDAQPASLVGSYGFLRS